jgi:uncharacterized protein (TIGR02266 family)
MRAREERRSGPRVDVSLKVTYEKEADLHKALIRSMAVAGLFIETEQPFEPGCEFSIVIVFPGNEKAINAECQVVWTNLVKSRDCPMGMGVRFTKISEGDKQGLRLYVEASESKQNESEIRKPSDK